MANNRGLLIITPMQEERVIVQEMLAELGLTDKDLQSLQKERTLSLYSTGMGAINTMNAIYNIPHVFEKEYVDVMLIGFAGALAHELRIGDSCQVATVSHFNAITCQEAGDFEIVPTPSLFFDEGLVYNATPSLAHLRLTPTVLLQDAPEKTYNMISVPALLQGEATKAFLHSQGIDIVDMEGYSLALALQHIQEKLSTTTIHLDIVRVITDSPSEKFQFSEIEVYKDHLRQSTLLCHLLKHSLQKL